MAVPYLPLGISAAVLGGILLFAPRAEASDIGVTPPIGPNPPIGPIPPDLRRWPPGTAVAIVAVDPNDPGLQGRQPGVRVRSEPTANSTLVSAGIANGERLAVLSGEIADAEGRKWRRIATLGGLEGYAPFVGPDGRQNMQMAPESAPWPGANEMRPRPQIPVAGVPGAYAQVGGPAHGWAPWGSAWAPSGSQADAIGQLGSYPTSLTPGGIAVCTGELERDGVYRCRVYGRFASGGPGWTVIARLPAGSRVRVGPTEVRGAGADYILGPGADYVLVTAPGILGWVHRNQLQGIRPRAFGRFRPGLPDPALNLASALR